MGGSLDTRRSATAAALTFACALLSGGSFAAGPDDKLTDFEYLLLGLSLKAEPPTQVVPRNTPTGVAIELGFSNTAQQTEGLLDLLPAGLEVVAELVGPGILPQELRGQPGEILPVPPLAQKGVYLVRDIRLEKEGELFLRATPDTATIEVIERVLVTEVRTRPLTIEEIRQKGILFGDDSFTGFNFTLALKLDSRPVTIDLPVIFDSNEIPVPTAPTTSAIGLLGETLGNVGVIPVMLTPDLPAAAQQDILPLIQNVSIPGLVVIPGDVGFLNQFFSALLLVSNGAPGGSGLTVGELEATIALPAGDDQVPDTADDPLVVAETQTGGQAFVLPIRGLGPDNEPATSDDTSHFAPGEQGQAEFLLEGRGEGFHPIDFEIAGTLDGLPIGPVPIRGTAKGGVVVRNPFFNMTFSAPATVRAGEDFTLYITVTNISDSIANLVSVSLNHAQLSGATLNSGPTEPIDTLAPGDSELLRFEFTSGQTGQVTASYLNFDQNGGQNTGDLQFSLGVGERGAPLSPDTIVLPASASALPDELVTAALRVLGQGWSLATAPAGTIPAGVLRVTKQTVFNRASELAEAGFRVQLGESLSMALESLAFGWASVDDAAFDQLLRDTDAGRSFFEAVGQTIANSQTITDFQRDLSMALTSRSDHVLVGVGSGAGSAPLSWQLADDAGGVLVPDVGSSIENAAFVTLANPADPSHGLALVTRLGSTRFEWSFTADASGSFDLGVSTPRGSGEIGYYVFAGTNVAAGERGRVVIDLLAGAPPVLELDRDANGSFEETVAAAPLEILTSTGPTLLSATVIGPDTLSGADPWGRVIALLFDREMRADEAEDTANYVVEENVAFSSIVQLSGRLVFLFVENAVGDLVVREVTASDLFSADGEPLTPNSIKVPIGSLIEEDGAIVSGRVLQADGMPVANALVQYIANSAAQVVVVGQKTVDADGRYQFDYVQKTQTGGFRIRGTDPATGAFQELFTQVGFDGEHIVSDLVLLGRGGVTGVVFNNSAEPVAGATVLVTSTSDPSSFALVETDGVGRYIATDIVVGPVAVKAVSGTVSGVAAGNLQRAGTFTEVNVTVNLTAGRVIGNVVEETLTGDFNVVPNIDVYYLIPNGVFEIIAAKTTTAEDGVFVFEDLPTGPFKVVAVDRIRSRQAEQEGTLVEVGGVAEVNDFSVIFFEAEAGTVTGTITNADGSLAEGALVTFAGRQELTSATGAFQFTGVPYGTYSLTARNPGSNRSSSSQVVLDSLNPAPTVNLVLPGAGQVRVTVLDVSGAPIPGLEVLRVTTGGCGGVNAITGTNSADPATFGVAIFNDVPIGNVSVKAIQGTDLAVATGVMRQNGDEVAIVLRFAGSGSVMGRVVDPNNQPVLGADVVLGANRIEPATCLIVTDGAAQRVKAGLDGTFRFDNIPLGNVSVSASTTFYSVPTTVRDVLRTDGQVKDFQDLMLESNIAGELSGTVFLPDGTTEAGAGVDVTVAGGALPDVIVKTVVDGSYSFAEIFPAGRYTVTASDSVTGRLAKRTVFLQDGEDLVLDLRLMGRASVSVLVLDGAGVPVDEAFIELSGANFPFDRRAGPITPSDGGTIVFDRITEGRFSVAVSDSTGRGGRGSGTVAEEGVDVPVTVSLSVTGDVTGTYKTANGVDPIPNAEVILRQGSTGRLLGATTTSSAPSELGTFAFDFVPAGTVLVTATDPVTGRIGEGSAIIETEGQQVQLEILQLGLGSISGTVTSGGLPFANVEVTLTSSTGLASAVANLRATASTDGAGGFMFDGVPVGNFTVTARAAGLLLSGTETGSIDQDGQTVTDVEIELTASGTVEGDIFEPDALTVVPGAPVTVNSSSGVLRTDANASGRYSIEFVPVGQFIVTAEEPGGPDAGINDELTNDLAEGAIFEADVIFEGTGTVQGTAFESDAMTPLTTGGRVRLTRAAPFSRDITVTLNPDGTFMFTGIPVGDYSLFLTKTSSPLRGSAMGNITADGETDIITVELADSGSVVGVIVKPDGGGGTIPVPNMPVTASSSGFLLSTLTDATGAFRIEGVPLGDFTLRAEDPITGGVAIVSETINTNGEERNLGSIELDIEPISIASVFPEDDATGVAPDTSVVITLTDPIDPNAIPGRFSLSSGGGNETGTASLSADGLTVTIPPLGGDFPASSVVDVFVSGLLPDLLGRPLGENFTSSFTTGGAVVKGFVLNAALNPVSGATVTMTAGSNTVPTTSDANGFYRFTDVPAGPAVVVATSGGLADSIVLDIGPGDGVVPADLVLAQVGSVSGQVFTFDGMPAGADLEVRVTQSNQVIGLGATAADGTYQIPNVPLGNFTVDVTNPGNGDRGQNDDFSITASGQQQTGVDVQLLGVGSVRVRVEDPSGGGVAAAPVELIYTRFQSTTTLQDATASNGEFVFTNVLAGGIRAEATDPSTLDEVFTLDTAVAGAETAVTVVLRGAGAMEGTVTEAGGTQPVAGATVSIRFENHSPDIVFTDGNGFYRAENLIAKVGAYTVEVLVGGNTRAVLRDQSVPPGGTEVVDITLVGLGTVTGTVLPPSGETLGDVDVTVMSTAPDVGVTLPTVVAVGGTYTVNDVPVGAFNVTASDTNGFAGDSAGVINADGDIVNVNVQLLDNAVTFPGSGIRHIDANGYDYRIRGDGALINGTNGLFAASEPGGALLSVSVDGGSDTTFVGSNTGSEEDDGREISTSSQDIDGVRVKRKIAVPLSGYFARYLESFENTTGVTLPLSVTIVTNIDDQFQSFPRVVDSSSGDATADLSDLWITTDDNEDGDPFEGNKDITALGFVLADGTGTSPTNAVFSDNINTSDGQLEVTYDLSMAPGERLVLMHFIALQLSRDSAKQASERLIGLPPEAIDGLSSFERAEIANFAVPAGGVSALPALPLMDGRVNGRFLSHDGTLELGTSTNGGTFVAEFQSDHPLFRRIRRTTSDRRFRFASDGMTEGFVIPRADFTVASTESAGNLSTSATGAGSFTGATFLHDSDGAVRIASSNPSNVDTAFDGNFSSSWAPVSDPEPRPFFDITLSAAATVDQVLVTPSGNADFDDVEVQLLDGFGAPLAIANEQFAADEQVEVSFASVANVARVRVSFSGASIEIVELAILGTTATDIGSAAADLVFADSATVDVITNAAGGSPAGADLSFQIGGQFLGSLTASDGRAAFAPVPTGVGDVTITATANDPNHDLLIATANAAISAGQTVISVLTFPQTAPTLSGFVRDSSAQPINNQTVTLFSDVGGQASVSTDSSGRYEFTDLPSGGYRLRVVNSGRLFEFPITVTAPTAPTLDIDIPLMRDVLVTVYLDRTDMVNEPAVSASIWVKDSFDTDFRVMFATNAMGQRTVTDVAEGAYTIRVRHPNVVTLTTDHPLMFTGSGPTIDEELVIPSFGSVTGTVDLNDGSPAADAQVQITGTEVSAAGGMTDGFGAYTFSNVRAARPFTVRALHPSFDREHIFAEVQESSGIVSQGASVALDLTLPATGTVNVLVTEPDGQTAVSGIDVSILDFFSSSYRAEGVTGADGRTTITVVPAGSFTVRGSISGVPVGDEVGSIASHGETVEVTIELSTAATVAGTVYAIDGQTPLPSATVELQPDGGGVPFDTTTTDSDGNYSFADAMAVGETRLVRAFFPDSPSLEAEAPATATAESQVLTVDLDVPVSVIIGRVLESDGSTPVAGATVEAQRQVGAQFEMFETTADPDGNFALFGQAPGELELFASDASSLSRFERVDLPAATETLSQDVLLPAFGTIEGNLTDRFGAPIAFRTVSLRNANAVTVRTTTTDIEGDYAFDRVAVGSYSVTYTSTDPELSVTAVGRVDESELEIADLALPGVGVISGQLRDSGGLAIPPVDTGVSAVVERRGQEAEAGTGIYRESELVDDVVGTYRVENVPVGEATVTIEDNNEVGAATTTIFEGAEAADVDVTLDTATVVPIQLTLDPVLGASGFDSVDVDGALLGDGGGFELGRVTLNDKPAPVLASATTDGGGQHVFGATRAAGFDLTRKVDVSADGRTIRYLEILENPHAFDVEVTLSLSGAGITLASTSSGDSDLDFTDRYVTSSAPVDFATVFAGSGAVSLPDSLRSTSDLELEWRSIVIPAGGKVIFMHFALQDDTAASLTTRADALMNLVDSTVYDDLTAEERAAIINFLVPAP